MRSILICLSLFVALQSHADLASRARYAWSAFKKIANMKDRPLAGIVGRAPTRLGQQIALAASNSKRNQYAGRLYCDKNVWSYNKSRLAPGKLACASVVSSILAKAGCDTGLSDTAGGRVLELKQHLIKGGFQRIDRKNVRAGDIVFWEGEQSQVCRDLRLNYPNHVGVALNNYATIDNSGLKSAISRIKSIHVHKIDRSCQKFALALRPPKVCPFKQKKTCHCSAVNRFTPGIGSLFSTCKWKKITPGKSIKQSRMRRKKRRTKNSFPGKRKNRRRRRG